MGWMHESDTHFHEATLVAVFDDGAESLGSTMVNGVDYDIVEWGQHPNEDRRRPSAEIVGWRLACNCARRSSSEVSTWTDPVQWACGGVSISNRSTLTTRSGPPQMPAGTLTHSSTPP